MTIIAHMPDPVVHYRARMVVRADIMSISIVESEIPQGVSITSISGLQSGSSSLMTWVLRVTDEDMDEVK